ncbi:MAG: hypothetical protein IJT94_11750 [Oscillibacter sp.]|nr:hypothetical protein [Oscillibacter sp.]
MGDEVRKEAKRAKTAARPESVYSVDELVNASELFGVSPDVVRTALRVAGITKATVSAAKDQVDKFRKKEVQ